MHTIKRILQYNSQRHHHVIGNGHVHSMVLAISIALPSIIVSIVRHDTGWIAIGLLAVDILMLWMIMEWGLYWTGSKDTTTNQRRSHYLLWFATVAAIVLITVYILVQFT